MSGERFNKAYSSLCLSVYKYIYLSGCIAEAVTGSEVRGQGPCSGVPSQETAQLNLKLRLAFTVKIVNPGSPHRPLRKHVLYLNDPVSF